MKTINQILQTKPEDLLSDETLSIIAMVRPVNNDKSFEISLGETGKWIPVPVSQVKSVQEIGVYESANKYYSMVQLELQKPAEENIWFEYLLHVINTLRSLELEFNTGCNCDSETKGNNDNRRMMASRLYFTGKVMKRVECMWNGYSIRWCSQHGM